MLSEEIAMVFRVGQKVVCVDDSPDRYGRPIHIVKDAIYTISEVVEWWGEIGVRLVEVSPGKAAGWIARRFRPVVERKTDISIFTEILNGQSVPEKTHV